MFWRVPRLSVWGVPAATCSPAAEPMLTVVTFVSALISDTVGTMQ